MAVLKDCILDVLTKLTTLDVTNRDHGTVPLYARIWNNQIAQESDGSGYVFAKPAAFVEVLDSEWQILSQGYRNSDLVFRIHLCHEFYNQDGTLEQDTEIFDLRDAIIELLTFFTPAGCGPLCAMREQQSFEHKNIYEYIIDFVCNFTDSVAKKVYSATTGPTSVEFVVQTRGQSQTTLYTVQQGKGYTTKYTALVDGEYQDLLVLDENGNKIIGANLIAVFKEIHPLVPNQWTWSPNTSTITLLNDPNGPIRLSKDESIFIVYQQNIY